MKFSELEVGNYFWHPILKCVYKKYSYDIVDNFNKDEIIQFIPTKFDDIENGQIFYRYCDLY